MVWQSERKFSQAAGSGIIFLFAAVFFTTRPAFSEPPESSRIPYALCKWSQPLTADGRVRPDLTAKLDRHKNGEAELRIYEREKLIFSCSPGLFPVGIHELQDGNLASLWSHANGRIHLYVFTVIKGKVQLALNVDSKLMPEFVYQTHGVVATDSASPEVPFYIQRIVVAHVDWVKPPGAKDGDPGSLQPVYVDIFSWDSCKRSYSVKKRVPWQSRFEALQ